MTLPLGANIRYQQYHYGTGQNTPSLAKLQAGTLEDTLKIEPELHIWTQSKQAWGVLATQARQFETQPDNALEILQAAQECRVNQ